MKEIKILTAFLFLVYVLNSCNDNSKTGTSLNNFPKKITLNLADAITDSMNLSEIAERVEYIPLQTTDSTFMGDIYDFIVTQDYIFIKDELRILKYNKNGKFGNSLFRVGHGPGEAFPICFAVDEAEKLVYVFDRNEYIMIYDFDGRFNNSIKKPINPPESLPPWSIGCFNNSLFIAVAQRPQVKYIYSCYDLKNDSVRVLYNNHRKYDKSQEGKWPALIPWDYNYQINDSCIMYKERFCDTIFQVNKDFLQKPRYIIDLGRNKLEWEVWRDQRMFHLMETGPPFGYTVQSSIESKSFLFLSLTSFMEPQLFALFDKDSQTVRIYSSNDSKNQTKQVYLKNDLDHLIAFPPANKKGYIDYFNGCLYSIINAADFEEAYSSASERIKNSSAYLKSMHPVLSEIDENSNPVIMKVYLK